MNKYKPVFLVLTFFILTALLLGPIGNFPLQALDSPTPTETDEKIKGIRDTFKEKVKEQINEIKKSTRKAFVGTVSKITNQSFSLNTKSGPQVIKTSDETEIVDENRKEIGLEDIKLEDNLIAMGYLDENDVLKAKRVVLAPKPEEDKREIAAGIVTDLSKESLLITLRNENKVKTYTILVNNKTNIKQKEDDQIDKGEFKKIAEGDFLIAIGTPEEDNGKIITAATLCFVSNQKGSSNSTEEE